MRFGLSRSWFLVALVPALLALTGCALDWIEARIELPVDQGSIRHVTLVLSENAVDDSDVSLRLETGGSTARILLVPDDEAIEVLEVTDRFGELYDLGERCQRTGPCRMGFTIDVVEANGPFDLLVRASASRGERYDETDFIAIELDDP